MTSGLADTMPDMGRVASIHRVLEPVLGSARLKASVINRKMSLLRYLALAGISLQLILAQSVNASLAVKASRVDHLQNPIGLDSAAPRFSWRLESDQPATLQTAYELRVYEATSGATLWESGKVNSDQSLYVTYAGPALSPGTRYQWQVRVRDNHGQTSEWSEPAFWETGLIHTADWDAQWITYPWQESLTQSGPSPKLRRTFANHCAVASARIYITALGLYEAWINGQRVGDAHFTPGWTSYDKRLQYQVYDVTDQLRVGENAIGIRLGDGWYRGFMTWEVQRNLYGEKLAARAQIRIQCQDGSEQVVNTDQNWMAAKGSIRASDIYNGEVQDLRLAQKGWSRPDFNDQGWQPAVLYNGNTPVLVDSQSPPVRVKKVINPIAMFPGPNGETIVDMGQNMVGWVRLRAAGHSGDEIVLHHAEVLGPEGGLYREALRNAEQRMSYMLADDSPTVLEPHFTFQGFRYVSIEGYPGELTLDNIEGVVLYSDIAQTGHFETSSAMLNQLNSNILWGQRGNFLDVPTDCPQRDERMGWTGDAQVFARTAMYTTDSAAFFNKWLADVRGDQYRSGAIPVVVPNVIAQLKTNNLSTWFIKGMGSSTSGWGDAITEIPMALFERYGDEKALLDNYGSMRRWVEYQRRKAASLRLSLLDMATLFSRDRRYIWSGSYTWGDWLAPEPASYTLVNTVYFARSTQLLAETARILGKTDDAHEYEELFQNIRKAFQGRFYSEDGTLQEDIQGAYVLALQFGLLEPEQAEKAADRLNQLVVKNGNHLATGFLSTPYLLSVLERYGYLETAYAVLMNEGHPSWLYPITQGATTIWERWGSIQPDGSFGDNGMNSFNHYAYGAVGDWMYQHIGGIRPLAPGYRRIKVAPQPGGELTHALARFESAYGIIESRWEIADGELHLSVEIPANTTAQIVFPSASGVNINGAGTTPSPGVESVLEKNGKTLINVGSGRYLVVGQL